MICPRCNATVADGSAFCQSCGLPMTTSQQPGQEQSANQQGQATKICPYCNSVVANASPFCTTCGAPMANPAQNQQYYAPNQQAYAPNQPYYAPMYPNVQPKFSGKAIASFVLSLVSYFTYPLLICNVLAIIFAVLGMKEANSGKRRGKGLAIAGLVIGIITLVFAFLFYLLIAFGLSTANIKIFYS